MAVGYAAVVPCRTLATDIETGEQVLIGSGRLDMAFRASSSVPMVLAPVHHQGRVLVDGAVVNPRFPRRWCGNKPREIMEKRARAAERAPP